MVNCVCRCRSGPGAFRSVRRLTRPLSLYATRWTVVAARPQWRLKGWARLGAH